MKRLDTLDFYDRKLLKEIKKVVFSSESDRLDASLYQRKRDSSISISGLLARSSLRERKVLKKFKEEINSTKRQIITYKIFEEKCFFSHCINTTYY